MKTPWNTGKEALPVSGFPGRGQVWHMAGLSPAERLAGETIDIVTLGIVQPWLGVPLLGLYECVLGIFLVSRTRLRLTVGLLLLHMMGTAMPILLLPDQVFVQWPIVLTFEGQYIAKNAVLVTAAFVVRAGERERRSGGSST